MTLEKLKEKHAKDIEDFNKRAAIYENLHPETNPIISISFFSNKYFGYSATIMIQEKDVEKTLSHVQKHWEILYPYRVQYGDYRQSTYPIDPPTEINGKKVNRKEKIGPIWLEINQYTNNEACFYARNKEEIYKFNVDIKRIASLHARKNQSDCHWWYEPGTCRIKMNDLLYNKIFEKYDLKIEERAYVDSEQGISGIIWFLPNKETNIDLQEFINDLS